MFRKLKIFEPDFFLTVRLSCFRDFEVEILFISFWSFFVGVKARLSGGNVSDRLVQPFEIMVSSLYMFVLVRSPLYMKCEGRVVGVLFNQSEP
ncbi:unnamed protein product [Moneuplotes crassus]|uniref:Uncharacterized protein n=1 Tax=Euplotes crassus TaxID=5936 RepID=A0AAD1U6J1_EUPCR|nr:unnamed protein product [Moneuplotes crassus]